MLLSLDGLDDSDDGNQRRDRNDRCDVLRSGKNLEGIMTDPHQVISIMATTICDARKDHPDYRMDPEEAKQIAKCIVEALTDAGIAGRANQ